MTYHAKLRCLVIGLSLLTVGCAIGDVPSTPPPPVTLSAPPTLVFAGECAETAKLEDWLQATSFIKEDFLKLLDEAASHSRGEAYADVLRMAENRDKISSIPVPDCAVEAHLILVDAMTKIIDAFQAFVNGAVPDVRDSVAEAKRRFDLVTVYQNDLTARMEAQYKNP